MGAHSGNGDSIRRYLLGGLSEQEREQVEQRLMADDDLYQRLLLAEDDLIEEYISGTLSERDQANFSRRFLQVPELRQDVRSIMVLRKYALETAPQVPINHSPAAPPFSPFDRLKKFFMRPALGVAFAAALLAAILVAVWLAAQNSQLRKEVEQLQARQMSQPTPQPGLREELAAERLRNEQLSAELLRQQELLAEESRKLQQAQSTLAPKHDSGSGLRAVFAFALGTGAVRESGELKKVSVPPDAREVRIRLDLAAADYRSYRAVLQTVEGREVFPSRGLRASAGMFLQLRIPAKLLTPGDYQIRLSGVSPSGEAEEIDSYYFRVLK
jgi:hypothetical protein